MNTAPPITNSRYYQNRTKAGNPTASKVRQGLFYYTYGTKEANPELLPRGEWYGQDGVEPYRQVQAWAQEKALTYKYTYSLLLSLRDGWMKPDDFIEAMKASGEDIFVDWKLIPHTDTAHDHAHVLAFRDTVMDRQEFRRWKREAGRVLQAAEQQRLQEQSRHQQVAHQPRQRGHDLAFDDDLAFDL